MGKDGAGRAGRLALALGILLAGCSAPWGEVQTIPPEGARLQAVVHLSESGPDQPGARYEFPTLGARETVITLRSAAPRTLAARISCDGPARIFLAGADDPGLHLRPGASRGFGLPSRHETVRPRLVLPPETAHCTLDWGAGHRMNLTGEARASDTLAAGGAAAACPVPATPGDALAAAFFAERSLAQTCPRPTGPYALYPDELEALQMRLERLTGSKLSRAALAAADPDMALDFSRAPRLDEIVISYLQVRADNSGYLIARALAFHAARGTKVRMIASDRLALPEDRRLFEGLAARYPGFQIQYFDYRPRGFAPLRRISANFENAHHIKIFAAISETPGASFALVGGRNLHDGFFYPFEDGRPKRPGLIDYTAPSLDPVKYMNSYEDFEIGLFDRAVVGDVVAHFDLFWNRDGDGAVMPRAAGPTAARSAARRDGLVRHFISVPWADARAHEAQFVDLFDAAQREIVAISPFLYPTPAIDAALLRAAGRGVEVRLVSRFLSAEPLDLVVNSMNVDYAKRRDGVFAFHAYDPGDTRVSHIKLIVIDGRLAIVTSTNLNRRSFVGDSENGLVFLDRAVAGDVRALILSAADRSEPFPEEFETLWLGRLIDRIPFLANLL